MIFVNSYVTLAAVSVSRIHLIRVCTCYCVCYSSDLLNYSHVVCPILPYIAYIAVIILQLYHCFHCLCIYNWKCSGLEEMCIWFKRFVLIFWVVLNDCTIGRNNLSDHDFLWFNTLRAYFVIPTINHPISILILVLHKFFRGAWCICWFIKVNINIWNGVYIFKHFFNFSSRRSMQTVTNSCGWSSMVWY
jgi:hypothetical protein